MANNETTTKFKVDISELKKSMQEAKRQVAVANSEFKAASSTMDDWSKSSDGLSAKLKQLDSNLKSQKSILSSLEAQYELTVAEMGEGSKAADDLKIKINNQKAVINQTEREIAKYSSSLEEVSKAEKKAALTGKDVADVLEEAGNKAEEAEEGFTVLKGAVAEFAGNVLTGLADALKEGITQLLAFGDGADKAMNNLQATTGMGTESVKEFEDVMIRLYNSNYGESFEDIADAMATVKQTSGDLGADEIENMTKNAIILRDTFDFEVAETMRAVNMLMDQFGISADEAFNLVAKGAQNGLNKNGDLLDTINEYGVHYAQMGVDAEGFFNSLINGAAKGTFSVDKLGDAYKEFGIRAKDGSDSTAEAFEMLGLTVSDNSESIKKAKDNIAAYKDQIAKLEKNIKYAQMQQNTFTDKTSELTKVKTADNIAAWSEELKTLKKQLGGSSQSLKLMEEAAARGGQSSSDLFARFAEGGESAQLATQEVLTALAGMEDKVQQDAAGVALFGTMWEDLGKEGVFALMDISNQSGALDGVYDTMASIDEIKYDSVGQAFQEVGRNLQTSFLMPLSDELLPVISELVTAFKEWISSPEVQEGIKDISTNITDFIQNSLIKLKEFVGWFLDNKDAVVAGLAAIAAGFIAFKVVSLIQGVTTAMQGMTAAQWLLNAAMNANPIGLVVAAIAALVAAFVYLWNNSEAFRNFWISLWENIKEFCAKAIDAIVVFFTETVPTAIDNMVEFFKELPTKIWTWLLATINKVIQWRNDFIAKAKEAASSFLNKVIEFVKQLPAKAWTWLLNTIKKIIQWRADMIAKAIEIGKNFVTSIIDFVKELPSKVWTWLVNVVTKIAQWGGDLAAKGKEAAKKLFDSIVDKIKEIPDKIKSIGSDIVRGLWNGINDMVGWVTGKIKSFGDSVLGGIKDFFGINSPSKLMEEEVGQWLPKGIAVGIDKNAKSVLNSMRDLTYSSVGAVRDGLGTASGISGGGVVNNFTQVINSPKQLSRLDIYRQSKNLLGLAGGGL